MDNIKRNRVSLEGNREEMDDPVAILTDITKAYPRVNRIMHVGYERKDEKSFKGNP